MYGRSDKEDFSKKLEEREWGNELEAGEAFEKSYQIHVKQKREKQIDS